MAQFSNWLREVVLHRKKVDTDIEHIPHWLARFSPEWDGAERRREERRVLQERRAQKRHEDPEGGANLLLIVWLILGLGGLLLLVDAGLT